MIRLKEDDVIKRVKALHPALDFNEGLPYTNTTTKFKVVCKIDGYVFETTFNSLLSGRGCKRCADNQAKVSNDDFIKRLKVIYGDRFSYSLTQYQGTRRKVKILCNEHNNYFEVLACTSLQGKIGCEDCVKGKYGASRKLKIATIIDRLKESNFYNDNYNYPDIEITSIKDKLKINCKIHGDFYISCGRLLRGSGCQKCAGNYLKSSEEVRKDIESIAPNLYDTTLLDYKNNEEPFILKTMCCGKIRYATIDSVVRSPKCPYCTKTRNQTSNVDIGYFYILKLNLLDKYKIGITSDFTNRFEHLQYNTIKSSKYALFTTQEPYFLQKIERDVKRIFNSGSDDSLKETFSDGWTEVIDGKDVEGLLTYLRCCTCLVEESK